MLSPKQVEYLENCNHRWNIKVGATGSGKSWLDFAVVIPKRLMAARDEGQYLILGNTQGTADRNILEPMRNIWGERLVGSVRGNNFANIFGKKVYVMGADNKKHIDRIRGMTIEYAYGDEMTTWSEGVFQMLKSRLRCEHSVFDGTGNPDAPTNYVKKFIDSDADVFAQKSTIFDNPFLPDEFVENLCKEYEGTVYYERYILGEWALAEGLIYPMYKESLAEAPESERATQWVLSIDYGTQNAFAALLWAKYGDVWYAVKEYYYSGRDTGVQKTDEEYENDLSDWLMKYFEEHNMERVKYIKTIIDPSAASFIALLNKKDGYSVRQANNSVADGIRETATSLKRGRIKITKACENTIREFQGYVWDNNEAVEKPIKVNDHAMDALRYFVKTMRIAKPVEKYVSIFGG